MGWGLAGTGNASAAAVVAPGGGGGKWKSQNRVGFLENRVKSRGKQSKSTKKRKIGI